MGHMRPMGKAAAVLAAASFCTLCQAGGVSKAEYNAMRDRATADAKAMRARCDELSGNRKDVCIAEAKATEARKKAEAEAAYKNTPNAARDARVAAADADYDVAKARCGAQTGNDRKLCLAQADAARRKARTDADASAKIASVQDDANKEKIDADYKVALEKCNLLGGASKDACVSDAKVRFGK